MKNKWKQYKEYLNINNKTEININNSFHHLSNKKLNESNIYSYIHLFKLIKNNNDKKDYNDKKNYNYNNKNLILNKEIILFLLYYFVIISLVNPILNEKIIYNKRKLSSMQIIKLKAYNDEYYKIINSRYIPNRIYIDGIESSITKNGYINTNNDLPINEIILEWEEKEEQYTGLFFNVDRIIEIDFVNFDMTGVTSISNMFKDCGYLEIITFTNFDTSSITDMSSMFENCYLLDSIDFSNFDTSNVKSMQSMFKNCYSLILLNLSFFRTPHLTIMDEMFASCDSLENIDLSSLDTSLVTSMSSLFYECKMLTSLNITNFITNNVILMNELFMNCESLESIDLSKFDTSNTINMSSMFYGCSSLISLNLSNFNTLNVENMEYMFYDCEILQFLDISNFDTSEVVSMGYMFSNCLFLTSLDISSFDLSQKNIEYLFANCNLLSSIKFSKKYKLPSKIDKMFYGCSSLTSLDLYNFDFGLIDNMEELFFLCNSLTSLDLSNIDTYSVTSMARTFFGCHSLIELNLKKLKTPSLLTITFMFYNCYSLKSLDLTSLNTSLVKDMSYLFYYCTNLTLLDISNFDTSKVTSMAYMFGYCHSFTSLNLSSFNTLSLNDMRSMFDSCYNLTSLDLSNFNFKNIKEMPYIFNECIKLEYINFSYFDDRDMYFDSYTNTFREVMDNLVYCIYNSSDNEQIRNELSFRKCSVNDCSTNWKNNKKKIIPEKGMCINDCVLDNLYKYEYEYICYDKCPKGTHSNKKNIYLCESNVNGCLAKYPFISLKDNICDAECHSEDFFNDICSINIINNQSQNNSQYILISTIINEIEDGSLNELLLEELFNEKNDIIKIDYDILYQITSSYNQNNKEYENISTIKLGECEFILKKNYNIPMNKDLIIFKTEQYIEDLYIPLIEYEIFNPITNEKLNLDYCRNESINIEFNIPVSINENNLIIYNPNDSYYNDICFTHTTDKGTDITLYDRQNEFNNKNLSICPKNCFYKDYNFSNSKVTCLCQVQDRFSLFSKINSNELIYKFVTSKRTTNFDILKCYKLLFSKRGLIQNAGSYIVLIIIFIYILFSIFFYLKEYTLICEQINDIINAKINNFDMSKSDIKEDDLKEKSIEIISSSKKSKISKNNNKSILETKSDSKTTINKNIINNKNLEQNEIEKTMEYIDFEINTIPYKEAIENDKRTFFQYYISLIKLSNILIFTFNRNKDYNSYIIKICLLLFSFPLYMLINTFFFNDSFMNKIILDKGKYNFGYALPKIIYSLLISSVIFILYRRLFLIHQNILEIKHEKNKFNLQARVTIELKRINFKFISFFIFSFVFLLFFWYYLSCFCAVYKNTQIYLIKNTLISYTISLIYPFIICLLPGILRISAFKRPGECLYKISQIIILFS